MMEGTIALMVTQLNNAYKYVRNQAQLNKKVTQDDLNHAYNNVLRRSSLWKTKTVEEHFPFKSFRQHTNVVFPADSMVVEENRTSWRCRVCDRDESTPGRKFHRQNCLKHFRSKKHCQHVAATQHGGDTVAQLAQEYVFASELADTIADDAIVTGARKCISLSALPCLLDISARSLFACRGKTVIRHETITRVRDIDPDAAKALVRLNAATAPVNTCSGTRAACRRSRSTLTRRMLKLSEICVQKKVEFLSSCRYLGLTCDESDTFSASAPLAVALQGCSPSFEWGLIFMGQTDVATAKTGQGTFLALRSLLDEADTNLFECVMSMCTDGASAMRSTPHYAGLDSNPQGTSLHAEIKRAGKKRLPNMHCICHQLNLALKKALGLSDEWSDQWLSHVKAVFNWFSKSPARKAKLRSLHKQMKLVRDTVTWKMLYPKYYCPTRWLGIHRSVLSIISAGDLLEEYTDTLERDGWRPRRESIPDHVDVLPAEAQHARVEEDSDSEEKDSNSEEDSDSEEEQVKTRAHAADFYKWGTEAWDLHFKEPEDLVIADEKTRLGMDNGKATVWKDLKARGKHKTTWLLSERVGMTAEMMGINAIMADALLPYKHLVERLQIRAVPIGHNVRRWTCQMFKELKRMFLTSRPFYGAHYRKWATREDVGDDLAEQVFFMGQQFEHPNQYHQDTHPHTKIFFRHQDFQNYAPRFYYII